ncbi:MAG TPA: ABC transporter permease [Thermoanaerobaculia bacterium]
MSRFASRPGGSAPGAGLGAPVGVSGPASAVALPDEGRPERREWLVFLRRLIARRTALFGLIVVAIVVVTALAAPLLSPFDPIEQDLGDLRLKAPGFRDDNGRMHLLGTDHLGRDLLARVIYGARPALLVGFAAVAISGLIGMAAGLISGYFGGRMDDVLMRLADIQLAFPFILLAIAVIGVLGPSLQTIIIVIGVSSWVVYARIVRGAVLTLREREFVQAALALGGGDGRVLLRHILPNVFTPWLVVATLDMARVIVIESALSFLGLGVQPPTPSWGAMLTAGRRYLGLANHLAIFPGAAIMLAVMGLNFLGDGLIDALDPKFRKLMR